MGKEMWVAGGFDVGEPRLRGTAAHQASIAGEWPLLADSLDKFLFSI
jgi:hypothetical protein